MNTQNTRTEPTVMSYRNMRRFIGFLAMSIPIVMLAGGLLMGCHVMMPSISHYFFTYMGTVFTGTLCAVGVFLITYKGFGPVDDLATNFAGICAFVVALFPTTRPECDNYCVDYPGYTRWVHYAAAALFFLTLALISIYLFTRSDKPKDQLPPDKKKRNRLYRWCGCLIIVFIGLVPVVKLAGLEEELKSINPTFCCETVALFSFSLSWLVKGEVLMKGE